MAEKEREALECRSAPDWLQKAEGTRSTVPTLSSFFSLLFDGKDSRQALLFARIMLRRGYLPCRSLAVPGL
jgi:hypothetical protein